MITAREISQSGDTGWPGVVSRTPVHIDTQSYTPGIDRGGKVRQLTDSNIPPRFPLPTGHVFGPGQGVLMWHDGRSSFADRQGLSVWQQRYRSAWWSGLNPTGVYDGATQRAAVLVQRAAGFPVTGLIDRDTWEAAWTVRRPSRTPPPTHTPTIDQAPDDVTGFKAPLGMIKGPVKGGRSSGRVRYGQTSKQWHERRRFSQYGIEYGVTPDAPPWWPSRPFGHDESGWHVRMVQELLGIKVTGTYNRDTERRVRGYQRMHPELNPTGILDLATARSLDPGPYDVD